MANTSIVTAYNMFADRKEKKEIVGFACIQYRTRLCRIFFFQCQFESENENKKIKNNIIQ